MNGFAFGCTIAYLCTVFSRRYQQRSWQRDSLSTSKTFKAMKQNRSPTKSAEQRLNKSVTYRSRIVSVSISYQSRIVLVSIPYRSRIVLLSFSYRSRFRKRKQYGNDTETIEEAREKQGRMLPTQNIFKFLKLYNYGKTQWYLNQTPRFSR